MMARLLRLLVPRRHPPATPEPDAAMMAALAYGEGDKAGMATERIRCATILRAAIAEQNRPAAEILAFETDTPAPAAVRLLTEVGNLAEAQQRTGPAATHYADAARTINERKPSS